MERFDNRGMLIVPNPIRPLLAKAAKVMVACGLYCPNGHPLISRRALFNGHPGILLKIRHGQEEGLVALSPIYGEKVRVSLDMELPEGECVEIRCPTCSEKLPVYTACHCGGDLIALFLTPAHHFRDCIGVCNRVGCINACVISNGEMVNEALSKEA